MRAGRFSFRYSIYPYAAAAAVLFWIGCAGAKMPATGWEKERNDSDAVILAMLADEDYRGVLDLTARMMKEGIRDTRLLGQRALALGMTGGEEEAISLFNEALLNDYSNCENHLNLAVLLMKTGKTGRAMTEFREAGRFCGAENRSMIKRNLAVANIKMGRETAAAKDVEEGLATAPDDPYLLGLKGMLIARESPAAAESLFTHAISDGGISYDFLYQLGLIFMTTGRAEEAVLPLAENYSMNPDDLDAGLNYSESLIRTKKFQEAEEVLLDIRGRGDGKKAEMKLADLYCRMERYDEALAIYREAGEEPEVLDRIAFCLHRTGRTEEGIEMGQRVAEALPRWTTGLINLSAMLASVGRLDEAEELLGRVLEIEPDNMTARYNLEKLKEAGAAEVRRAKIR
ncbi:MAG: tetratricopeptide repeat protein [Candidatus Krumholzibacteriota bacterium]|nr:tetratricopeptide repeat protein [Candidatus Krumholzibacteriota bacterium]